MGLQPEGELQVLAKVFEGARCMVRPMRYITMLNRREPWEGATGGVCILPCEVSVVVAVGLYTVK